MSNKFLFELGTEEIPAGMIPSALSQLCQEFETLFSEHEVGYSAVRSYSTPRRLTVVVEGLPDHQPDRNEVLLGPPTSVALSEGKPTAAAMGFARKCGVDVDALEVLQTERGEYLGLRRQQPGKRVSLILQGAIPEIISSLSWPKSMYWRESRFRFIRPLRWFVALFNGEVIPFELEGVSATRFSRGHRILGSAAVEIKDVDSYVSALRAHFVLVDPAERKRLIEEGLARESAPFLLSPDPVLLETVVHLNEFPSVLRGSFDQKFLRIPQEVLVTVMRFHQKYFSLVDVKGEIAPSFLTVLNTDGDRDGCIRQGHEKVLHARLEDAAFFWETDQKVPLEDRVGRLSHILFQEKLGNYLEKTERVQAICGRLDSGSSDLQRAAQLCKADLTTDMVREFPELQGIMGGLYAKQQGGSEPVWRAIYDQYRPIALEDEHPAGRTGVLLSIADRLDTIVGCFGIDIIPTGSSDPFALRRQAQGLVSLLLESRVEYSLENLVRMALENFKTQKPSEETLEQVLSFLGQRVQFVLQRKGIPNDVIRAVMAGGIGTVCDAFDRASALVQIKGMADFEALAMGFKRIKNILSSSSLKELRPVDPQWLGEEEERSLFDAYGKLKPKVAELVEQGDYLSALKEIAGIRSAVDRFFDSVLVMAEDSRLKENRLALLDGISTVFLSIADISEVSQQGGQNG